MFKMKTSGLSQKQWKPGHDRTAHKNLNGSFKKKVFKLCITVFDLLFIYLQINYKKNEYWKSYQWNIYLHRYRNKTK